MVTRNPTWVEQDYQLYADDGVQGSATTLAAINTSASIQNDTLFRCRLNFGDTNNANANNVRAVKLQFRVNAAAYADVGAATAVRYATSAHVTDGTNDANERLSAVAGSTFTSAWQEFDSNNATTSRTWGDTYTEYEFCLQMVGVAVGATINLRAVTSSNEVPTVTNTPTITVAAVARTLTADGGAYSISGTAASLEVGRRVAVDAGSYSLSGTTASLEVGRKTTADAGNYVISGTAAALGHGWRMTADAGSYAVVGTDATLSIVGGGVTLAADPGSYAITGDAAALLVGYEAAAAPGSYAMAGQEASLELGRKVAADVGSYAMSGTTAVLAVGKRITADGGSYAVTGADATLTISAERRLVAESGSYSVVGQNAALLVAKLLSAEPGIYVLTGNDAALSLGRPLVAEMGSYSLSGTDASFVTGRMLAAGVGAYNLTGTDASMVQQAAVPTIPRISSGTRVAVPIEPLNRATDPVSGRSLQSPARRIHIPPAKR